jgi:hypothetical protein
VLFCSFHMFWLQTCTKDRTRTGAVADRAALTSAVQLGRGDEVNRQAEMVNASKYGNLLQPQTMLQSDLLLKLKTVGFRGQGHRAGLIVRITYLHIFGDRIKHQLLTACDRCTL